MTGLTMMAERTRAAEQLLRSHRDWSDRAVAEQCGLDHKTVGRLRAATHDGGDDRRPAARLGRDGRLRPVDPVALRLRIAEVLSEEPTASLRWVASHVGASPETVRDVRERVRRGDDPVPAGLRERRGPAVGATVVSSPPGHEGVNAALGGVIDAHRRSRVPEFAAWFAARAVDGEWLTHAGAVPLSRVYEVADQARARARAWQAFAQMLEHRALREAPTG
jgi:hypothetical protein